MEQISIRWFKTKFEAEMTKKFLEAYGIKSLVQEKGFHSSGIPDDSLGIDLFVLEKDVNKAKELLESRVE
jgi:hypothetical protein